MTPGYTRPSIRVSVTPQRNYHTKHRDLSRQMPAHRTFS